MTDKGFAGLTLAHIISGIYAITALFIVNTGDEIAELVKFGTTSDYWLSTAALGCYLIWLIVLYIAAYTERGDNIISNTFLSSYELIL